MCSKVDSKFLEFLAQKDGEPEPKGKKREKEEKERKENREKQREETMSPLEASMSSAVDILVLAPFWLVNPGTMAKKERRREEKNEERRKCHLWKRP